MGEYLVDGFKHLGTAAEVLGHGDECPVRPIRAILPIGRLKEGGIGKAESVDALLHIADDKAVRVSCDLTQDALLQAVRILIFVHHDCIVMSAQLLCNLRRHGGGRDFLQECGLRAEERKRRVFEVAEVKDAALQFFLLKRLVKCACQACVLTD